MENILLRAANRLGNESAFPLNDSEVDGKLALVSNGLTKREYFAAMAMQGIISHPDNKLNMSHKDAVYHSLVYADALLLALAESEVGNG